MTEVVVTHNARWVAVPEDLVERDGLSLDAWLTFMQ